MVNHSPMSIAAPGPVQNRRRIVLVLAVTLLLVLIATYGLGVNQNSRRHEALVKAVLAADGRWMGTRDAVVDGKRESLGVMEWLYYELQYKSQGIDFTSSLELDCSRIDRTWFITHRQALEDLDQLSLELWNTSSATPLTQEMLELLGEFENLKWLEIHHSHNGQPPRFPAGGFRHLRILEVVNEGWTDESLAGISNYPELSALILPASALGDHTLAAISKSPQISTLQVDGCDGPALQELASLQPRRSDFEVTLWKPKISVPLDPSSYFADLGPSPNFAAVRRLAESLNSKPVDSRENSVADE